MGILVNRICKILLLAGFLMLPVSAHGAWAQGDPVQLYEQKIKAGLVYNFLKSTSWPDIAQPGTEQNIKLKVCLFGGDPFDGYLLPMEGRTAQRHTITISQSISFNDIDGCRVLFVNRNEETALPELFEHLEGKSILTISDMEGFSEQGGMIELATEKDRRVHIIINKKALESAGLDIQDSLMKLAQLIE